MCHLSRSVCAALFGTLLCILVRSTSSLKVLRDSDAQNLTQPLFASLQADSAIGDDAMGGAVTTVWPHRNREHMALPRFPLSKLAMTQQASSLSIASKTITRMVLFIFLSLLCVGLALGYAEKLSEESSSPDLPKSSLGHFSDRRAPPFQQHQIFEEQFYQPQGQPQSQLGPDGDWTKKYQAAEPTQKQALDLLYLCDIIPKEEFLNARVSQDHIDECVWIANVMLKQKTIMEWNASGDYAREFFNSCVTALYEARADIKDTQKYDSPERMFGDNSPGNQVVKERVPLKRLGTSMLLNRCREIMADTRRDSMPKTSPRLSTALDLQNERT